MTIVRTVYRVRPGACIARVLSKVSTQPQERRTYPIIPAKNWWALRRRFQQTMPRRIDTGYLQTVLGVQEGAAQNLISPLRAVGLIDETGNLTDRAADRRTDEGYAKTCEAMLTAVYPEALLDAVPPSHPDRDAAKSWFSREARVGEAASSKMAASYVLLAEADSSAQDATPQRATQSRTATERPKKTVRVRATEARAAEQPEPNPPARVDAPRSPDPSLHIDIQVHIPSDASPEQIDSIFASMAKHLYRRS